MLNQQSAERPSERSERPERPLRARSGDTRGWAQRSQLPEQERTQKQRRPEAGPTGGFHVLGKR
eukprot:1254866-Alexandrium_andersonii.AAC.1